MFGTTPTSMFLHFLQEGGLRHASESRCMFLRETVQKLKNLRTFCCLRQGGERTSRRNAGAVHFSCFLVRGHGRERRRHHRRYSNCGEHDCQGTVNWFAFPRGGDFFFVKAHPPGRKIKLSPRGNLSGRRAKKFPQRAHITFIINLVGDDEEEGEK